MQTAAARFRYSYWHRMPLGVNNGSGDGESCFGIEAWEADEYGNSRNF